MENNNIAENLEDFNNIVVANYSYDNGFLDGILGIEPEHFRRFIENNGNRNLEKTKLAQLGVDLLTKENELNETKAKLISNNDKINTARNEEEFLNTKIEVEAEKLKKLQDFLDCRSSYLDSIPNKTSNLTVAIIFILVAACFLVADVAVIKYVFRELFSMKGWEGWMYSIAVALVSFVFKPAIDRIFEKPYLINKSIKTTNVFYITVSILTIFVIGCIGYIRVKGIPFLMSGDDNLLQNFLQNDIYILFAFIGCAILFPICGSICLSIGISSIDIYRNKKRVQKDKDKSQQKMNEYKREIKEFRIQKENAIFALSLLRSVQAILEDIKCIKEQISENLLLYFAKEIEAEQDIYNQAMARGEKYNLTEELRITPAKIAVLLGIWPPVNKGSNAKNATAGNSLGSKSKSGYLHEQLRSMIEYNHKKN